MSNYTVEFNPDFQNGCWNKAIRFVKEGAVVLDVGCSNGNFAEVLKAIKNCTVDGVEPDAGDARTASKKMRKVYNSTLETALKDDKLPKYDHIIFMDVIEHIVDPVNTLKSLKPVLKKDGSVIFSIPNMAHMSTRLMLLKGGFEYGEGGLLDKTHLHFYNRDEVEKIFSGAGLTISTLDHTEAAYPDDLVSSELKALGLLGDPQAISKLNSETAKIFQYVGEAVFSGDAKQIKRKQYSPDPQGQIEKSYTSRIAAYEAKREELELEIDKLKRQIASIEQSTSWSVTKPLRKATGVIKRSLR